MPAVPKPRAATKIKPKSSVVGPSTATAARAAKSLGTGGKVAWKKIAKDAGYKAKPTRARSK